MADRDRLIELINDCRSMDGYGMDLVEKQADYLLANGVIVPPCTVIDTLYVVNRALRKIEIRKVSHIKLTDWNEWYVKCYGFSYPFYLFGKTVFLTKEEAEAKLKEMEK